MNGIVTGFDATPYASPTIPGNDETPVQSRIHARIPGTIANNSTTSQAEDGEYELTNPCRFWLPTRRRPHRSRCSTVWGLDGRNAEGLPTS